MADKLDTKHEATLRDFLNVVFRRKWMIVAIVGLAAIIVVLLNEGQATIWESSSRILVRRGEQPDALTGSVRYLSWAEEVSSQIQVIMSDDVFARAREIFADSIKSHGLSEDIRFSSGSVRADVMGESNVFVIRYMDLRPELVNIGCTAITESFSEYYAERKTPPALTDFFTEEIIDVKTELDGWRDTRNEFLNREKFFGASEENRFLLSKIGSLESRLLTLNSDISTQKMRADNLKALSVKSGAELEHELTFAVNNQMFQSGIVTKIKFSLQTLGMQREELLHKFTERHPEVVGIDQQIHELHANLEREVKNAARVEAQALEELYARRAAVVTELGEARSKVDAIPDKDFELTRIEDNIRTLEKRYEMLLQKQSESEIAIAGRPEWEVTVLSRPSGPYTRKTRDYVRLSLGPLLSLIVALGLAFFLESIDHSVKNVSEVEEYLGKSVLATISERR